MGHKMPHSKHMLIMFVNSIVTVQATKTVSSFGDENKKKCSWNIAIEQQQHGEGMRSGKLIMNNKGQNRQNFAAGMVWYLCQKSLSGYVTILSSAAKWSRMIIFVIGAVTPGLKMPHSRGRCRKKLSTDNILHPTNGKFPPIKW